MDIERRPSRGRWVRRATFCALALAAIPLGSLATSRLEPATPKVDRSSVAIGTVERGEFVRRVRGQGTLIAEEVTVVTARIGGQVRRVAADPGIEVQPDTVLLELWNPSVERAEKDARHAVEAAQAQLDRFKLALEKELLDLKAATAQALVSYEEAKSDFEVHEVLVANGLIAYRQRELARGRAERNRTLFEIQVERVNNSQKTNEILLRERTTEVRRAEEVHRERMHELDALTVRAGVHGVLTHIGPSADARWQVGQRAGDGMQLARIINPQKLKAVLQIDQTQAREVAVEQRAEIDTLRAVIPGRVIRIDPAVYGGTVTVDVALEGELPQGARPDLMIDGTIELEHLSDVLYMKRPPYSQANSTFGVFRLEKNGLHAVRTDVTFGRGSVNTIEIREGLQEGDQVILSDTSILDGVDRITFK